MRARLPAIGEQTVIGRRLITFVIPYNDLRYIYIITIVIPYNDLSAYIQSRLDICTFTISILYNCLFPVCFLAFQSHTQSKSISTPVLKHKPC